MKARARNLFQVYLEYSIPRTGAILQFSQVTDRGMDGNWSSWDVNQSTYGMLAFGGGAFANLVIVPNT